MKQWCMQCNRMTEHGTGGCLEHNVEIHITDHTMDKTQEAFEKRKPLPGWPKGVSFVFKAGYEEGQKSCKCCGSCIHAHLVHTGLGCFNPKLTATGEPDDYNVVILEGVCDEWEAR